MHTDQIRIPLPRLPEKPPASPFPIIALIAPLVAAGVMWAITGSTFVIIFAVLGPVMALAALGDSRRRSRRELKNQRVEFDSEVEATRNAIDEAHERERAELERGAPGSSTLRTASVRDSERWRTSSTEPISVRLGTGAVPSRIVLDSDAAPALSASRSAPNAKSSAAMFRDVVSTLHSRARVIQDAPVVIDARLGIGICGTSVAARALASSLVLQLANKLSPVEFVLAVSPESSAMFPWIRNLPHQSADNSREGMLRVDGGGPPASAQFAFQSRDGKSTVLAALAEFDDALPRDCRVIVSVTGSGTRVVHHPHPQSIEVLEPDLMSHREALQCAQLLREAARGVPGAREDPLSRVVEFFSLSHRKARCTGATMGNGSSEDNHFRTSLRARIGKSRGGPVEIDLVTDGPHAIVGGITGSGKSEVLVTWVLALAMSYSAEHVNFFLVDFKGGAAFAPVAELPHVTGVLTDLDESSAHRAILSLRAELRRREQVLAIHSARSFGELPVPVPLPRLVIVVDEFATLASTFAEVHELFADIAARGRSLGIHLILCTQRPSGSIKDVVLANCTLRISLRVNSPADSLALLGVADAAQLPPDVPGRALMTRGGAAVLTVQWAIAGADDARTVTRDAAARPPSIARPWLDPLPSIVRPPRTPSALSRGIEFGIVDVPEEQRRDAAVWNPPTDGNLLIVGSRHSGKTTALTALAHAQSDVVEVPPDVEGAWDDVTRVLQEIRVGRAPKLVVVDDVDILASRFGAEHETAFLEMLASLAREGTATGTALALTASTVRGRVQQLAGLCEATLVLRMKDRQEHQLVGGAPGEFSDRLPAGAGHWRGHRVQVFLPEKTPQPPRMSPNVPPLKCSTEGLLAVVSPRPEALRDSLAVIGTVQRLDMSTVRSLDIQQLAVSNGATPSIVVGDLDAWQSSHVLLSSVRSRAPLAFHDCSPSEFRSISRLRSLPPPVDPARESVVVLEPDATIHRALLPAINA